MFNNLDVSKKIGAIFLMISFSLYFLGVLFILNKTLLLLGNVFFFLGFFPVLGYSETLFFFQRKIKGSICFAIGLIFILTNVVLIGLIFQIYGLYDFFNKVFPKLLPFIYEIPYSRDVILLIENLILFIKTKLGLNDKNYTMSNNTKKDPEENPFTKDNEGKFTV